MYTTAPSVQLVTHGRMPLAGPQPDMRSFSSPAELQAYDEWMSDVPDVRTASVQPLDQHTLPRAWCALSARNSASAQVTKISKQSVLTSHGLVQDDQKGRKAKNPASLLSSGVF